MYITSQSPRGKNTIENRNKQCSIIFKVMSITLFACWFQPGLISQSTVFSSHNKPASGRLISPETNKQTCRKMEEKDCERGERREVWAVNGPLVPISSPKDYYILDSSPYIQSLKFGSKKLIKTKIQSLVISSVKKNTPLEVGMSPRVTLKSTMYRSLVRRVIHGCFFFF